MSIRSPWEWSRRSSVSIHYILLLICEHGKTMSCGPKLVLLDSCERNHQLPHYHIEELFFCLCVCVCVCVCVSAGARDMISLYWGGAFK